MDWTLLSTIEEIVDALQELETQEEDLVVGLRTISKRRDILESASQGLEDIRPEVDQLIRDGVTVFDKIAEASETAERVSSRVKSLDVEQERVKEVLTTIQYLQDLKMAIQGIYHASEVQDWHRAAVEVHRARQIPRHIVDSQFAQEALPTADLPDLPGAYLDQAITKLNSVFTAGFEAATRVNDEERISFYFRLFPLIGKEDVGLAMYSTFVCSLVAGRTQGKMHQTMKNSDKDHFFFANLLKHLFESIALIVAQHHEVVIKHYGKPRLITVLGELMKENDRQGLAILRRWSEERKIEQKVSMVNSHDFVWLSQVKRQSSKARTRHLTEPSMEEPMIDSREIDRILGEMSMMMSQWANFARFMSRHSEPDPVEVPVSPARVSSRFNRSTPTPIPKLDTPVPPVDLVSASALSIRLDQDKVQIYRPVESWFLRRSIERAHQLEEADADAKPAMSSVVDDALYVFKKIIYRITGLGNLVIFAMLVEDLSAIFRSDFADLISKKIQALDLAQTTLSREMENDREKQFMVLVNNLDIASGYLSQILEEPALNDEIYNAYSESDLPEAKRILQSFKSLTKYIQELIEPSLNEYFVHRYATRLTRLVSDAFKDVTYQLDEDGFEHSEAEDAVHRKFCHGWQQIIGSKDQFTEGNLKNFVRLCIRHTGHAFERQVAAHRFNELGALRFDQDVRSVSQFLVGLYGPQVKDHLRRLSEVATLLNLEDNDYANDLENPSLTEAEITAILELKVS